MYGNGTAQNDVRLLKVVNFAARVITGLRKHDRISRARTDLHLLTPRQMCDLQTVIMAHKTIMSGEPTELTELFQTFSEARTANRVTRQDDSFRPPSVRTAAGQRSFAYRAASLLNDMPAEVRQLPASRFKRAARSVIAAD